MKKVKKKIDLQSSPLIYNLTQLKKDLSFQNKRAKELTKGLWNRSDPARMRKKKIAKRRAKRS